MGPGGILPPEPRITYRSIMSLAPSANSGPVGARWNARTSAYPRSGEVGRGHARMPMRARLMTALSLVLVNSQPFLRQPVSRWISTVVRQARLPRRQARVGIPAGETQVPWACFIRGSASGYLHRTSPTGRTFACTLRTCAAAVSGSAVGTVDRHQNRSSTA